MFFLGWVIVEDGGLALKQYQFSQHQFNGS